MVHLGNSWDSILAEEFSSSWYMQLREFLKYEYSHYRIYPGMYDIFNALKLTDYDSVKAVILGQDPYHGAGQAHGLCFSVREGVEPPPSLKNIFRELHEDTGVPIPVSGELTKWAQRGVLLLNTTLTVREGRPQSHKGHGWELLTDAVIRKLNERERPVVFILWGSNARAKKQFITAPQHLVLESAHPSPLSAYNGFFGGRHFSKTNAFLARNGIPPIDWDLTH
ncbi:MAG: uracil-DNA glycosylase [Ruminococcus sp.]|nr:uracil-DNA glycosylase [Ruminococcus sp.]